jgi:hypothetical protein
MTPLTLDAAHGEGGGQVLRTALALAVALGRPVVLRDIRRRRPRPGLQPQHLTVVRALAAIADADVTGDALGSRQSSDTEPALPLMAPMSERQSPARRLRGVKASAVMPETSRPGYVSSGT